MANVYTPAITLPSNVLPPSGAAGEKTAKLLQELWPEPNWSERIAQGLKPTTAALLHFLYQGFAKAPLRAYVWQIDGEAHKAAYIEAVGKMRELFEQAKDEELDELQRKFHAMTGVSRDMRGLSPAELLPFFALGHQSGRTVKSPFALTHRSVHLARALPDLGWPEDVSALKTGICHWRNSVNGMYGVARFTAGTMQQLVKPVHNKATAISEAKRLIEEEIERHVRERKAVPRKGRAGDLVRSGGADLRAGRDVTVEQLVQRYRLRGVEFEPSLNESERTTWLNHAHDALHDLSVATGMPPGWLGLARLGLAIGFAGKATHFDVQARVLHLSGASGAVSLANSWAHGLDHHLATRTMGLQQDENRAGPFLSGLSWQLASLKRDEPAKSAIALAMLRIVNYMRTGRQDTVETGDRSDFMRAARTIGALKGAREDFWTSETEMFARAFEATVQDRLASAGIKSPWLVRGTLSDDLPATAAADPFPQGKDRRLLGQLIEQLLNAIIAAANGPAA